MPFGDSTFLFEGETMAKTSYREKVRISAGLKECPFCGGVAVIDVTGRAIKCTECKIHIESFGEDLKTLWNTRNRESAAATLLNIKDLARVKHKTAADAILGIKNR